MSIKTYSRLCKIISQQLRSGVMNWPLYVGTLGVDSTGGSDGKVYAALTAAGFLTIDSQEGTCEQLDKPTGAPKGISYDWFARCGLLTRDPKNIGEIQHSYVLCFMPTAFIGSIAKIMQEYNVDVYSPVLNQPNTLVINTEEVYQLDDGVKITVPVNRFRVDSLKLVQQETLDQILEWDQVNATKLRQDWIAQDLEAVEFVCRESCISSAGQLLLQALADIGE